MITPNEEYANLAEKLGVKRLFFKREDLHPLGSHKGRSIPHMMDYHGKDHYAISSSGNAALAAALYAKEKEVELDIYVGRKIANEKLYKLQELCNDKIRLHQVDRPLQEMQQSGHTPLRQSTDDVALEGYQSLIDELKQIPNIGPVFIGTSSGTTAQALSKHFDVRIVQTTACHPFVEGNEMSESIADAIVDKIGLRKDKIKGLKGYIATNEMIKNAQALSSIPISTNSALSLVGLMEALYTGEVFDKTVVCIITGN